MQIRSDSADVAEVEQRALGSGETPMPMPMEGFENSTCLG